MEQNDDKLKLQHLAGGSITKLTPFFSPDASLLFVATDKVVQVFSSTTGQTTRFLEGANEPLISLEYELLDSEILVACTEAGEVLRWRWSTGKLISQVKVGLIGDFSFQTFNFLNSYEDGDSAYAFITAVKGKDPVQCFLVNSVNGYVKNCPWKRKLKRQKVIVDVDNEHFKYIALAQGQTIYFIDYTTWSWTRFNNANGVPITCVKIHPKELIVATGDEIGKVMLWRQFFQPDSGLRTALYHWHHTPVTSVAFSYSGSGFYSSGLEAVLVKWNISEPHLRRFLPRMSAIILHVATSQENTSLAVCTADNAIQILDVELNTKCTLQEFTYITDDKTEKNMFPVGLKVNPRQNTIVLNGRAGHLQFYSAYSRSLLYNMDIVGQNLLSFEIEKILYNIQVTQAAFNIDWMATVELFNDEEHLPELRLKFWEYNKENQSYVLNTNVELPHEGGVKAIEFSSPYNVDNLLCATAGIDNTIKIWALEDSNNIYKKGQVWYCVAKTSYKNFSIDSIGFSHDGSLLAAGFGNTLCVYNADNLKLLSALLPSGTLDGCLHKAQVEIPMVNRNGSKKDLTSKKQKVMQLFTNLLHGSEETLIKEIKKSVKSKNVQELHSLSEAQKIQLYKKIKSLGQLNLFQKLLIYKQLGISFELSKEWHSKIIDYVRANALVGNNTKELTRELHCLNLKSRFKAKYKLSKYISRKSSYETNNSSKMVSMLKMLKLSETPQKHLTNGVGGNHEQEEQSSKKAALPPMLAAVAIRKVAFCYGDFAHLVIACTENRVLIWNLLTLRLQSVLKLSTEQIAVDPQTNLISVFTKNQELFVFLPSADMSVYYRANMPRVHGAVWLPRKQPKSQAIIVNWQARSTLYFLTENQDIMYLGANDDFEQPAVTFNEDADDSAHQYSTFGAFAVNQFKSTQTSRLTDQEVSIGVHGRAAVKSFLEMSTHTMAPLSLLCNDFLKEVIQLNLPDKTETSKTRKTNEMDISDESDSDDKDDKVLINRKNFARDLDEITARTKTNTSNEPSEEYLRKIAAETILFDF